MKKAVQFLVGLTLLVAIASTLFILLSPSEYSYSTETEVMAPAQKCYEVFLDVDCFQDWMDDFKSIRLVKGNQGEIGAQYELSFEQGGEDFKMIETITAIVPNEHFQFDYSNEMMSGTEKIQFINKGNKTIIKTHSTFKGKGKIMNAFFGLAQGGIQESSAKMYTQLGALIERN